MTYQERKAYEKMKDDHYAKYYNYEEWSRVISEEMKYQLPHFNVVEGLEMLDSRKIYISCAFVAAGRQDYCIQYGKRFHFNTTIAGVRSEDLVIPDNKGII